MGKSNSKKKAPAIKSPKLNPINSRDITAFKPTHIKFNFSFLTTNKSYSFENPKFTSDYKAQLLTRIIELSAEDYILISGRKKSIGLEFLPETSFAKKISYNNEFQNSEFRKKSSDKFAVFRIYTNNNPIPARVIGKVVNNIFYVFFIDLDHSMYSG